MKNMFEKPLAKAQPDEEILPPLEKSDQDIDDYDEDLAAQHREAEEILRQKKDAELIEQHEQEEALRKKREAELFEEMIKNKQEDNEETKRLYGKQ